MEMPPGSIIFEDPPTHDAAPRPAVTRVHAAADQRPRAEDPRVLRHHASIPSSAPGGFDFIHDLGAYMPMRTIGMLLGIPEADQEALRERIDKGLELESAEMPDMLERMANAQAQGQVFARVRRLAGREPVRRPHDRAPQRRVRGHRRRAQEAHPRGGAQLHQPPRPAPATRPPPGSSAGRARPSPSTPTSSGRSPRTASWCRR